MTFKFTERKAGDVLQSSEWNAALYELMRLNEAKVNREGADRLEGPLTINGALTVGGSVKSTSLLSSQQGGQYSNMATFESYNPEPPYVNWNHHRLGGTPVRYGYIQAGDFSNRKEFRFQAEQDANFVFAGGKVGIGISTPAGALEVRTDGAGDWNRLVVTGTTEWGDGETKYVTLGAGGASGIMLSNPHITWRDNRASIRYGRAGGVSTGAWWDVGVRSDNSFSCSYNSPTDHKLTLDSKGVLNVPAGAIFNGVAAGVDPPGDVNFPYAYETIGTTNVDWNLRLHSYNAILFHVNNQTSPSYGVNKNGTWLGSTAALKDNISDLTLQEALEVLEGLNPAKFSYKADETQKPHAGFIAETVPDLIANADRNMISEMDIIAVLTKVVKEQQRILSELAQQLADTQRG